MPTAPEGLAVSVAAPSIQAPTAADVLYANELQRGRLWVTLSGLMGALGVGAAALVVSPGLVARELLGGASAVLVCASAIGMWVVRGRDRYGSGEAALYTYLCLAVALPAYHFFGWFSPVLVVVCVGGIVFAMGHTTRAVVVMALVTSISHLTLGALTIAGVVPDVAVASVRLGGTAWQLLVLVSSQVLFALFVVVGRQFRAHALEGVERYGAAVRETTRREALLQEAIDELRRARKVGDPGRFTQLEIGSFRLGVVLGRGGMGEVYDATHLETAAPAAVKVLTAGQQDHDALRRFEREIIVAASITSPHIVRVLEHSTPGAPLPYLAMERLQGMPLSEELRGRLAIGSVLRMLREVAEAVDAAHAAGVVHRDLKPQNIFHHTGGGPDIWKVLDFGAAKLCGVTSDLTGLAVIGTPSYMSPEQATGTEVDRWSDIFALGCIAYRCLTGQQPFRGADMMQILQQVIGEMPVRPSHAARLPGEVDSVLAVALAKDPRRRFKSAAEFATALAGACDGRIDAELAERAREVTARTPWAAA